MNKASVLKERLNRPGIIIAPGVYDCVSAKLVEGAEFEALYMTGYGTSASLLGMPDYGYITLNEMADNAGRIARSVDIPLIADADTGFGNALNVIRTVQEYEKRGVAAFHIEDQVFPKRCGHMEGKMVIPMEEHVQKIRAAVDAREHLLIIARTDARAPLGLDEAIRRAVAYKEAGADIIFVDAPQSAQELEVIAKEVEGPLFANMVEGGKTPSLSARELEKLGYKIVVYPVSTLYSAVKAMQQTLSILKHSHSTDGAIENMVNFTQFNDLMDLKNSFNIQEKYAAARS
ncbi:oxaloacetate decarboxylase [Ammoniphilus sp. YIM 78166]|uniref:isocitrate lyase/PEP mutase family protein n=1 Tax=Ammoniphilus sp. YIM 78166 TaxID=1644106 RepID=UPI00106F95A6|nr:isocitrate lyase/PEP mutase family protein [Ammoniphilus sp. YIM 78166]